MYVSQFQKSDAEEYEALVQKQKDSNREIQQNVKNGNTSPNGFGTDDDFKFAYSGSGGTFTIDVTQSNTGGSRLGGSSTPGGAYYCQGWLRKPTASSPPAITGVSPTSMPALSGNQTLMINGNNFKSGATLTFVTASGSTIASTASKLTFVSSGQISYLINNAGDAGSWTVQVNNPDGRSSGTAGFTVSSGTTSLVLGIDVSNYQGTIDWNQVKQAGRDFAFIKATESVDTSDNQFAANILGAKNAGILAAAYHFARPSYGNSPEAEASYFVSIAGPYIVAGALRPALDFEDDNSLTTMTDAQLTDWVSRWAAEVKRRTGAEPMLYMDGRFVSRLTTPATAYPLWFAAPGLVTTQPADVGNFPSAVFKQYDWHGSVNGISGEVDLDVFFGDMSQLQSYVIAPPPVPVIALVATGVSVPASGQTSADGIRNDGGGTLNWTATTSDNWITIPYPAGSITADGV